MMQVTTLVTMRSYVLFTSVNSDSRVGRSNMADRVKVKAVGVITFDAMQEPGRRGGRYPQGRHRHVLHG